ncbi:hypothetical protein ANCCAN_01699 [Ancylostoma caninum]|uniref:SCP domain-containing protein n=1 Tax=Ancylostoma caninum TaxID=29170 RepID=A0A368H6N9_ANCCA|nr:hypothetical protein ANCCAN_01699 [Ancylostoma caninum]
MCQTLQMAWALSTRIGCAVVNCQSKTFTVCRYRQRGNIVNHPIYQTGPPCFACATICLGEGLCAAP